MSGAIVPPRIAYLLTLHTGIDDYRKRARGDDHDLDTALNAIRFAAMQYAASANGTHTRKRAEGALNWYTPSQVANQTGVTAHAVRLAIREGRLPAEKVDGHWRVSPADYKNFRAAHDH
ncbi:MAG: helix-turn-helix domain-containing protein [Beijerinckiaceae bacterium]|nr:helix-turn-helix domain-containing protein [Beijerinckiaceae bacterium]